MATNHQSYSGLDFQIISIRRASVFQLLPTALETILAQQLQGEGGFNSEAMPPGLPSIAMRFSHVAAYEFYPAISSVATNDLE